MSNWTDWTDCPVSCARGMQTRIRSCDFESKNFSSTAKSSDSGCSDAYPDKYYEEQECNAQSCRKCIFLITEN